MSSLLFSSFSKVDISSFLKLSSLLFEFEMPGNDIVGFEYEAKQQNDIEKVENAINILSDYKNLVSPSGSAECKIKSYSADVINEGKHSEFISSYKFNCKKISKLIFSTDDKLLRKEAIKLGVSAPFLRPKP